MFSVRQKREIAEAVQQILRSTNHTELPGEDEEIQFLLHVDDKEDWSWADIRNNGSIEVARINLHNELQDWRKS